MWQTNNQCFKKETAKQISGTFEIETYIRLQYSACVRLLCFSPFITSNCTKILSVPQGQLSPVYPGRIASGRLKDNCPQDIPETIAPGYLGENCPEDKYPWDILENYSSWDILGTSVPGSTQDFSAIWCELKIASHMFWRKKPTLM